MMVVSAADNDMSEEEITEIGKVVEFAPIFKGYDRDRITNSVAPAVVDLLQNEEGLDALLGMAKDTLPGRVRETAYAFACDIAAADGAIAPEEMQILEIIRHRLEIGRLVAAAIERGTRARHMKI
ncbi:MAG: tellurite resistance TerB family protein [Neomegalonema sp.]|nr:tellurite resistance TerB family protein [Neomegalonema sp.]